MTDHDRDCDCFKCKLHTIQFGKVDKAPQTLMEQRWQRDMPAYQRLRRDGLQPRSIDGAGDLETKLSYGQLECDMGHLFSEERDKRFTVKDLPRVEEGFAEAQTVDWHPVTPDDPT